MSADSSQRVCSVCGQVIGQYEQGFQFSHVPGYGSIYDGEKIELLLCNKCFDEVYEKIIDMELYFKGCPKEEENTYEKETTKSVEADLGA